MFSLSGKSKNQIPCFPCVMATLQFLPPTYKVRGRYCFHRCLSVHILGGGEDYLILLTGGGGTLSQVSRWKGGTPSQIQGEGYPIQPIGGIPHPRSRWGGTPPVPTWDGVPPCPILDGIPPPPSTCYVVGGMPLAFTQEDFLMLTSCIFVSVIRLCDFFTRIITKETAVIPSFTF